MKLRIPNKFPSYVGISLLMVGVAIPVVFINRGQRVFTRASGGSQPYQIKISNINERGFVVSWVTKSSVSGSITVKKSAEKSTYNDQRDGKTGQQTAYLNHYISVDDLQADSKYTFTITSEGYVFDNNGKPYEAGTASIGKNIAASDIAQGTIYREDTAGPATGAIVYLTLANTVLQSSLTDTNGHWMIPLSNARSSNLASYTSYDRQAQVMEIHVRDGDKTALAKVTTSNDDPVPDITLGQDYDFVLSLPPSTENTTSTITTSGDLPDGTLSIIYPQNEESINSQTPEFFGKAPNGKTLTIEVESEQRINDETQPDNQGGWRWTPKVPLAPGEHQITVSYRDDLGVIKKVTRKFTVMAAENNNLPNLPAFTATSSGQVTQPPPLPTVINPTGIPTASPTLAVIVTPTTVPTQAMIVTPTTNPIPTAIPTINQQVTTTGSTGQTLVLFTVSALLILSGMILLLRK